MNTIIVHKSLYNGSDRLYIFLSRAVAKTATNLRLPSSSCFELHHTCVC